MKVRATLQVDGSSGADVGDGWIAFGGSVFKTGASLIAHGLTVEKVDGPWISYTEKALAEAKLPFGPVPPPMMVHGAPD